MREPVQVLTAEPDTLQQLDHPFREVGAGRLPMDLQRTSDDVDHQMPRIERRERILEHHLTVASVLPTRPLGHPIDPEPSDEPVEFLPLGGRP